MEQPQYNMFHRERFEVELARLYNNIGIGTTVWSPLASGLLTGKYNNGTPDNTRIDLKGMEWLKEKMTNEEAKQKIEKVKQLEKIASELNTTMPRLGLAWCLKNPNVSTVITGASKVEQLIENLPAMELVSQLSDEVMNKIEEILQNKPKQPAF